MPPDNPFTRTGDFTYTPSNLHLLEMLVAKELHDRGYGYLDNNPIGGMDDSEWFGFEQGAVHGYTGERDRGADGD